MHDLDLKQIAETINRSFTGDDRRVFLTRLKSKASELRNYIINVICIAEIRSAIGARETMVIYDYEELVGKVWTHLVTMCAGELAQM